MIIIMNVVHVLNLILQAEMKRDTVANMEYIVGQIKPVNTGKKMNRVEVVQAVF